MLTDGLTWCLVLAQAEAAGGDGQPVPFSFLSPPILAMIVLFFFLMILPQRREQKQRDQMLKALKKNDRVLTSGGIIGTVANISADGKEITLKVDDNTRIKFLRSSITQVLGEAPKDESAGKPA